MKVLVYYIDDSQGRAFEWGESHRSQLLREFKDCYPTCHEVCVEIEEPSNDTVFETIAKL